MHDIHMAEVTEDFAKCSGRLRVCIFKIKFKENPNLGLDRISTHHFLSIYLSDLVINFFIYEFKM